MSFNVNMKERKKKRTFFDRKLKGKRIFIYVIKVIKIFYVEIFKGK